MLASLRLLLAVLGATLRRRRDADALHKKRTSVIDVVVGAAKRCSETGRSVVVRHARPSIVRVLEMTNVLDLLQVEEADADRPASAALDGGRAQ